ncbi:uncharacterized protein DS421_5g168820 [Arachis hypogaea]|nr:uncharacterized protein DS421_5g168820 [Arachis hypogaea]
MSAPPCNHLHPQGTTRAQGVGETDDQKKKMRVPVYATWQFWGRRHSQCMVRTSNARRAYHSASNRKAKKDEWTRNAIYRNGNVKPITPSHFLPVPDHAPPSNFILNVCNVIVVAAVDMSNVSPLT